MSAAPKTHGARGAATIGRLLDSASEILCERGAAAISVQRVADAAGTSKALVHYHFPGKDALLVSCIERLATQLAEAEGDALSGSQAASALSDLWQALMAPRARGWRRALLSLTIGATPAMGAALAAVAVRRHAAAARVLARLEALLGFAPSIPRGTVAAAYVALVDGLTLDHAIETDTRQRQAFDAFWLAVLSLEA
jgi:AcrR family transcriptional regulator